MEQRSDQTNQPVQAAGTDPAFVPLLMDTKPSEDAPSDEAPTREQAPQGTTQEVVTEESAGAEEARPPVPADGPVFEISDRRGSVIADHAGVRFRLDDQEAEFLWSEIGAVEVGTPRFGRRFTVTVHTAPRRWYETDVEAPSRSRLKEWGAELDAVLDAYFEEGA